MNSVLQRIKQFIDYKGITNSAFEKSVGFSNGAFASQLKNNRTIGVDKLENILSVYLDINIEWLLTGRGEMLKEDNAQINRYEENTTRTRNVAESQASYNNNSEDCNKVKSLNDKIEMLETIKELQKDKIDRIEKEKELYIAQIEDLKKQLHIARKRADHVSNTDK